MKVIDLLNKIANGEEIPKYIKYFNYVKQEDDIMMVCKENIIYKLDQLQIHLNDEVEIIENKKIEKLNELNNESDESKRLRNKINEIIDYINKENK